MKVISFINMKGGVAKTTLAVNVADCLVRREKKRVLLIDVDPQFNATQCLMNGENYYNYTSSGKDTIINIFDRTARPMAGIVEGSKTITPKKIQQVKPISIKKDFDLIPGALDLYMLEMAAGDGREFSIKNYLKSLNDKYDYVIIDTPPTPSVWMSSALLASNYYLIPTKADPISITGIDLLYSIIEQKKSRYGIDEIECCGVILTIAEKNTNVFKNAVDHIKADKRWKDKLYKGILPKRIEVARGQLNQNFILDGLDSEIKRSLVDIVSEIQKRVGDVDEE